MNDLEKQGYVSLWLGNCSSYDELDRYLSESYSSDGDFIESDFETDFNIERFDEDFREAFYHDFYSHDFEKLLAGCSYEDSVILSFINSYELDRKGNFNSGFLLYDFMYEGQVEEMNSKGINLKYIGTVEYKKDN